MPILNKTVNELIAEKMINHDENNRLLAMYVSDKNNNPMIVMDKVYVRNNYEMEDAKKKWKSLCNNFKGSYLNKNGNKLSLRIMETTDEGYQFNVLGDNVSLINFKC